MPVAPLRMQDGQPGVLIGVEPPRGDHRKRTVVHSAPIFPVHVEQFLHRNPGRVYRQGPTRPGNGGQQPFGVGFTPEPFEGGQPSQRQEIANGSCEGRPDAPEPFQTFDALAAEDLFDPDGQLAEEPRRIAPRANPVRIGFLCGQELGDFVEPIRNLIVGHILPLGRETTGPRGLELLPQYRTGYGKTG